ncbi:hypothetical protein EBG07_22535, partial [Salmonella enterica]|nr:hypothetical protein [Salmonella enterica]
LSNWLRQLSNPGRWFSSPLGLGDTYKQKARTSVQALNLNMAVRGGFEPRSVVLIPPWFGGYI